MSRVPTEGTKPCRRCGEKKPVQEFRVFRQYGAGDRAYRKAACRACEHAYLREWRERHPQYHRHVAELARLRDRVEALEAEVAVLRGRMAPLPRKGAAQILSAAIARALEACGGNRTEAARMLGIGRATVYRHLDRD